MKSASDTAHGLPDAGIDRHPLIFLLLFNRPYWRRYAVGALLAVFFAVVSLGTPFAFRQMVTDFDAGHMNAKRLAVYFLVFLSIASFSGVFRYFQRMLMIGTSRCFEYDLRNYYFQHILSLSRAFFHRCPTGDIMARATNDLNYVRDFVGPGIMGAVDMIQLPLTIGAMVHMSPRLTLLMAAPLPIVTLLVYFFVRFMHTQSRIVQELFAAVTEKAQENLAGARVVKAYGIADREQRVFLQVSKDYMRANLKLAVVTSMAWPMIGAFIGGVVLLAIWEGGRLVIAGKLDLANMTGFLLCLLMIVWPLAQFGWILTLYQRGAVSMERLKRVFQEKPDVFDGPDTDPEAKIEGGAVRFENVSFAYHSAPLSETKDAEKSPEPGRAALTAIDFEIPAGQTVAIVGPTGSGKSTLTALLAREYDPTEGRVLVDGRDIRQLPLRVLRGAIGCVPQDTFIFSETVFENAKLGRPDATDDEVRGVCAIAQLEEALGDMPDGMNTLLGERGINLSGGQKQRLALARALLCDPAILVLDDALSSVDTHTEERILEGLRAFMAGRTSLIIAHRISSIRHADSIVVLDGGRIVERGTHDELVALDGLYAGMYRRQLLETALEDGVPVEGGAS